MRILFIMDPIEKCDLVWDNSLCLLGEFFRRGHETWTADAEDLVLKKREVRASCRKITVVRPPQKRRRGKYHASSSQNWNLLDFDLILLRKDPPVDAIYLSLTHLLEPIAKKIPVVNHPRGVRETNEKSSILHFPRRIPKTLISSSPAAILRFQNELKSPVVIKPLDQKGGKGVFLLRLSQNALTRLRRATRRGTQAVMAQEFLKRNSEGEKRIVILNGKILAAHGKKPRGREFRANLGLGGTFHSVLVSAQEKQIVKALRPYLLKKGLYFVGIDVLNGKLIEINVTSPAGVTEAKFLNPRLRLVEAWADFLESLARPSKVRT